MNSAIYEGTVRHRRFSPITHAFRYRVAMLYLDLDELPRALDAGPLWSARRAAPGRFRRADYLGDPANKEVLMNNGTGSQPNMSLGQMNPELAQSLAQAMSPYVDEMAGRDLDGTSGWRPIDNPESDTSFPHASNVFGVLGTDEGAASTLDSRSASVQGAFINEYANSVIGSDGHSSDSAAMEAAGRLKGITHQGAFMSASDTESDAAKARENAYNRMAGNYDIVKDIAGTVPVAGDALTINSTLMREAILGPPPGPFEAGHTPIESSLAMKSALASTFIAHDIGDPADLATLRGYDLNGDGQLDVPKYDPYDGLQADYQRALTDYYSHLDDAISDPFADYDQAYRDVIK